MKTGPNFGSKHAALVVLSCALQQHTLSSTCYVLQETAAVLFSGRDAAVLPCLQYHSNSTFCIIRICERTAAI